MAGKRRVFGAAFKAKVALAAANRLWTKYPPPVEAVVDPGNASRTLDGGVSCGRPSRLSSIQRVRDDFSQGQLTPTKFVFDWDVTPPRIAALNRYRGCTGKLLVSKLGVEAMDQTEDHLLVATLFIDGRMLPTEVAGKIFSLSGLEVRPVAPREADPRLAAEIDRQQSAERRKISERNGHIFADEAGNLYSWAEALKIELEREIEDLDRQLPEARQTASAGLSLEDEL